MKKKTQIIIIVSIIILAIIGLTVGLCLTKEDRVENQKLQKSQSIEIGLTYDNNIEKLGKFNYESIKAIGSEEFEAVLKTSDMITPVMENYTGFNILEIFKFYGIDVNQVDSITGIASDNAQHEYDINEIKNKNIYLAYELDKKPYPKEKGGNYVIIPTEDFTSENRLKFVVKININLNQPFGNEHKIEVVEGKNSDILDIKKIKTLPAKTFDNNLDTSDKATVTENYTGFEFKEIIKLLSIDTTKYNKVQCTCIDGPCIIYELEEILEDDNFYIVYEFENNPYPISKGGRFVVIPTKDTFSDRRSKWLTKIEFLYVKSQ